MSRANTILLQSWRLYHRLGLSKVLHPVLEAIPPVRRRVERARREIGILERERLVPPDSLTEFYGKALRRIIDRRGADAVGDYLEFGVFNGTSMICMYRALEAAGLRHVRLFGFDSFEGVPDDEEKHWARGMFSCDLETTREILTREGVDLSRVILVKGFYQDTLTPELRARHAMRRAGVVMVDCDLYRSATECLAFAEPLLDDETVVCFDDWNPLAERGMGEKRAFDELLARRPDLRAEPFGTYCANAESFVIKRSS